MAEFTGTYLYLVERSLYFLSKFRGILLIRIEGFLGLALNKGILNLSNHWKNHSGLFRAGTYLLIQKAVI
jgi:hypothetical protein